MYDEFILDEELLDICIHLKSYSEMIKQFKPLNNKTIENEDVYCLEGNQNQYSKILENIFLDIVVIFTFFLYPEIHLKMYKNNLFYFF